MHELTTHHDSCLSAKINRQRAQVSRRCSMTCFLVTTLAALTPLNATAQMEASNPTFAKEFTEPIETAHGIDVWRSHEAVRADIVVRFGKQKMLEGAMVFDTGVGRVRMDLTDGTTLIFDGKDAWVSPATAEIQGARFHLLTWPYFLAAPMKLRDPGSRLEPMGLSLLRKSSHPAATLTFDSGIGDTPDDWYIVFKDPLTSRLAGLAYIVTYGMSTEEAEKEPHAVVYDRFVDLDGVAIPTRWEFYNWTPKEGAHGPMLGLVEISNVAFVEPKPGVFSKPVGARRDELPPRE